MLGKTVAKVGDDDEDDFNMSWIEELGLSVGEGGDGFGVIYI